MSCKSKLQLEDYAGNQVTVRCELDEKRHLGRHRRISTREGRDGRRGEVIVEWDNNIDDSEEPGERDEGGEG
jgi:hypothetical protein